MYTYYRIEETTGQYYFPWVGLYVTEEDARREMNRVINSGRVHARPRLRVVRYEQIGCGPPQRTKV